MSNAKQRLVISSIHVEPINRHEYNENLAENLTIYHKQKFFEFIQTERGFLRAPEKYSKLPDSLVNELNQQWLQFTEKGWIKLFKAWIALVCETDVDNLSNEDLILWQYITSNASKKTPTPNSYDEIADQCRICLAPSGENMVSLFEDKRSAEDEVSLVEKLNYCSCFDSYVHPGDHLPKYICKSCSILVENAYQLKVLCARSEEKFDELLLNHGSEYEVISMEIEIVGNEMPNIEDEKAKDEEIIKPKSTNGRTKGTSKRKYARKSDPPPQEYNCDICKAMLYSRDDLINHMTNMHMRKKRACTNNKRKFDISLLDYDSENDEDTTEIDQENTDSESEWDSPYEDETSNTDIGIFENEMSNEENHEVKKDESSTPKVMNGRSIVTTRRRYARRSNPPPSSQKYHCDICKAIFYSKKGLVDHMKNKHMGDKVPNMPHSCPECHKRFRIKSQMVIHQRSHTDERPYVCDVCGKAYKTISASITHSRVHTETKDFQCSKCRFKTNSKQNLIIHERTHSGLQPYSCKFCPMKFSTASNLAKHTRNIHENEKSFKCDKCSRLFFKKESLRKHYISHLKIKPFKCPFEECDVSYIWYNGLKKHFQQQHYDEKIPKEKFYMDQLKKKLP